MWGRRERSAYLENKGLWAFLNYKGAYLSLAAIGQTRRSLTNTSGGIVYATWQISYLWKTHFYTASQLCFSTMQCRTPDTQLAGWQCTIRLLNCLILGTECAKTNSYELLICRASQWVRLHGFCSSQTLRGMVSPLITSYGSLPAETWTRLEINITTELCAKC